MPKLKTTIEVEFEGDSESALRAALQRGLIGLREGIRAGMMRTRTGIIAESVTITRSEPEISESS